MVAAQDPAVAAVVLLAGPARPFRETMRYQHRYRIENDPSIAPADREKALAEAMIQQEANVEASTEAWRRSIQDRDPLPTARRLRMPVLILQGSTDRAVPPEDAVLLERALREGGNRRVERHLFPGVNHHFQRDPIGAREGYDRLPTQDLARRCWTRCARGCAPRYADAPRGNASWSRLTCALRRLRRRGLPGPGQRRAAGARPHSRGAPKESASPRLANLLRTSWIYGVLANLCVSGVLLLIASAPTRGPHRAARRPRHRQLLPRGGGGDVLLRPWPPARASRLQPARRRARRGRPPPDSVIEEP